MSESPGSVQTDGFDESVRSFGVLVLIFICVVLYEMRLLFYIARPVHNVLLHQSFAVRIGFENRS